MNLIADRLFALMLGWTNSLFNGIWNMLTNDRAGFAGFLQRFWIPIILVLLIFGTLTDYIIWLIRWRPYYVWSAWFRRLSSKRRMNQTQHYMENLDLSPLDLPEYQDFHEAAGQPAVVDEPVYFDFQVPWQEEEGLGTVPEINNFQPVDSFEELPPQFIPSLPWENFRSVPVVPLELSEFDASQDGSYPQPGQDEYPQLEPNMQVGQNDGTTQYSSQSAVYDTSPLQDVQEEVLGTEANVRRRRAGSKRQRGTNVFRSIRDTFFESESDRDPVHSIQPPVAQEDAFHKPYYPLNYSYRDQASPPPPEDQPPQ